MEAYLFFTVALVVAGCVLHIAQGVVLIQINADGNTREIGPRNITQLNSSFNGRIRCFSTLKGRRDISILKGGDSTDNGRFHRNATGTGSYSCRITAVLRGTNETYFSVAIESYLQINIIPVGEPLCATSAGKFGFISERVISYCSDRPSPGGIMWNDTRSKVNHISLSELELSRVSCGLQDNDGNWQEMYEIDPRPMLFEGLQIRIDPDVFYDSAQTLNFTCTSNPPRLISWEVLGRDGDIFESNYGGMSVPVNTSVTIIQHPGYTTLQIVEGSAGGNGIHTVRCYTYDTLTVVAEARIEETSTTTDRSVGDIDCSVNADHSSSVDDSGNADDSVIVDDSGSAVGFIVVTPILIIIIVIMGVVIVFMYNQIRKLKSGTVAGSRASPKEPQRVPHAVHSYGNQSYEASGTAPSGVEITSAAVYSSVEAVPPETVLEDNPAYEKSDTFIGNEPEYTYVTS